MSHVGHLTLSLSPPPDPYDDLRIHPYRDLWLVTPRWKQIGREIGAVPCASAKPDAIRVTTYKYLLRLKTTGEIVGKYHRRPSFAKYLKRMALKGRPDTLGQLELAPYEE